MTLVGTLSKELVDLISGRSEIRHLRGGETLFEQGQTADGMYFVVSGRLQTVVRHPDGRREMLSEVGRGEPVGEVALLTNEPRAATVRALRATSLVFLSREVFEELVAETPEILLPISRILAERLRERNLPRRPTEISTFALVSANDRVDLVGLAHRLAEKLQDFGDVSIVNAADVDAAHGDGAALSSLTGERAPAIAAWLQQREERARFTLYVAPANSDRWTRRCLGQADRILQVADARDDSGTTTLDDLILEEIGTGEESRVELVLLQRDELERPRGTAAWLTPRNLLRHHHVRKSHDGDLSRLVRFLSGRAVGLVMSGGGVLGFTHLGVLRALVEAEIPIDTVGGNSAGSFASVTFSMGGSLEQALERMYFVFDQPKRVTIPTISLTDPTEYERRLDARFGHNVEDSWLPTFCVATSFSRSELIVIRTGPAARALRCSSALPGLFPPVFDDGEVIVDGAVMDNLPVTTMEKLCPGPILGCDCIRDLLMRVPPEIKRSPSNIRYLLSRLNPFAKTQPVPNIYDLLIAWSWSVNTHLRQQAVRKCRLFFTPDTRDYNMLLDGSKYVELEEIGYRHACEVLESDGGDLW